MACETWKPKTCTERGRVDPSNGITRIAADELRRLIEEKDLVGGLTEGTGVVSYRGSMKSA
jgi:hypothetical protein